MKNLIGKNLVLETLEKFCFYLLLFAIPFQTRKFIWAQNWPINEWASIWFWGTDILILIILFAWIWSLFQNKKWFSFWQSNKIWIILGGLFWFWAGISLVPHLNYLSFYHWLKLTEIILFFLCLKDLADRKFLSEKIVVSALLASGLFQSILAISQFFKQSNLGLKILGESILSPTLAGVAKINLGGIRLVRAYGIFPHPSILAFFLFIIILLSLGYSIKTRLRQTKWLFSLFWLMNSLFWLALFLTFSRTTIVLALISVSLFLIWRKEFIILFYQVLLWLGLIFVLWPEIHAHFFQLYSYRQSIGLRFNYLSIAWAAFWTHPWLGVGWGNFVSYFISHYPGQESWFYQPVHNIYWLVLSEVGVFGFLIFLWLVGKIGIKIWNIRRKNNLQFQLSVVFFSIFLIIGLEDHFFLTAQQGWLLVGVMILGVKILLPNRIE